MINFSFDFLFSGKCSIFYRSFGVPSRGTFARHFTNQVKCTPDFIRFSIFFLAIFDSDFEFSLVYWEILVQFLANRRFRQVFGVSFPATFFFLRVLAPKNISFQRMRKMQKGGKKVHLDIAEFSMPVKTATFGSKFRKRL